MGGVGFRHHRCGAWAADLETVTNMVRGAEASGTTPIVRVAMNEPQNILRHLDSGAQGLQMPMVNGPDDAERAVAAALYPPEGRRGLAGVRAATFGLEEFVPDYAVTANAEMLVIVQIETVEALGNLGAILDVPGIDVVFFGATDLSSSMGIPGQTRDARVVDAIAEAGAVVMQAGLVAGRLWGRRSRRSSGRVGGFGILRRISRGWRDGRRGRLLRGRGNCVTGLSVRDGSCLTEGVGMPRSGRWGGNEGRA